MVSRQQKVKQCLGFNPSELHTPLVGRALMLLRPSDCRSITKERLFQIKAHSLQQHMLTFRGKDENTNIVDFSLKNASRHTRSFS